MYWIALLPSHEEDKVAWGWRARGWTLIYTDPGQYPLWYLPLSLLLYLLAHDTWFYWTHRLMHRPRRAPLVGE